MTEKKTKKNVLSERTKKTSSQKNVKENISKTKRQKKQSTNKRTPQKSTKQKTFSSTSFVLSPFQKKEFRKANLIFSIGLTLLLFFSLFSVITLLKPLESYQDFFENSFAPKMQANQNLDPAQEQQFQTMVDDIHQRVGQLLILSFGVFLLFLFLKAWKEYYLYKAFKKPLLKKIIFSTLWTGLVILLEGLLLLVSATLPHFLLIVAMVLIITLASATSRFLNEKNLTTMSKKRFALFQVGSSLARLVSFIILMNIFVLLVAVSSFTGSFVSSILFLVLFAGLLYTQECIYQKALLWCLKKRGVWFNE